MRNKFFFVLIYIKINIIYLGLLTITTLVSPASHISCTNSDSNAIAASSLSNACDLYKKRRKEFLQSSLKNKFLGLLKGQGKLKSNFYEAKHGTLHNL